MAQEERPALHKRLLTDEEKANIRLLVIMNGELFFITNKHTYIKW